MAYKFTIVRKRKAFSTFSNMHTEEVFPNNENVIFLICRFMETPFHMYLTFYGYTVLRRPASLCIPFTSTKTHAHDSNISMMKTPHYTPYLPYLAVNKRQRVQTNYFVPP